MKREDLLEKGYTEEQVTELLDLFHKNNSNIAKENQDLKAQLDTANDKITGLTKLEAELNAMKQAQLTDDEKRKLAEAETEANLKKSRIILNTAKAKEIFSELGGIDEEILKAIVTDDEAVTVANATKLLNQFKTFESETVNKTKEELSNLDTKPNPSNNPNPSTTMTWEQFESLSAEEQSKFAEEHPDEFANL